jgi:DegV family protein with EDD domain
MLVIWHLQIYLAKLNELDAPVRRLRFGDVADAVVKAPDLRVRLAVGGSIAGFESYEAAVLGARATAGPVKILDTTTAAGAQALVVLAAAQAAAAGASLAETEAAARAAIESAHLVATVPTLDHLVRSGRVPNIAGWAGKRLGLSPLFEFRDGRAHALRPARGMPAALDRMLARWRKDRVPGARLHVAALHARNEAPAAELLACVRAEAEPETAFLGPFGTVMVVHTGPGLVGLAWRWELP